MKESHRSTITKDLETACQAIDECNPHYSRTLYKAYLLLLAYKGGSINTCDKRLEEALSLVSTIKIDIDASAIKETPFIYPKYPPEVYRDYFLKRVFRPSASESVREVQFWDALLGTKSRKILDYRDDERTRRTVYYSNYDFVCPDKEFRAYQTLKLAFGKEDIWKNVRVFSRTPTEEEYDIVFLSFLPDRRGLNNGEYIVFDGDFGYDYLPVTKSFDNLPLSSSGIIILEVESLFVNPSATQWLINTGMLEMVLSPWSELSTYFILRKNLPAQSPIIFVDGKLSFSGKSFWSQKTVDQIKRLDEGLVVQVEYRDILPRNLSPAYYMYRKRLYREGSVPLKHYLMKARTKRAKWGVIYDGCIDVITTDDRLMPCLEKEDHGSIIGKNYVLSRSTIFYELYGGKRKCGYVNISNGASVKVMLGQCGFFGVKEDVADIRYFVLLFQNLQIPLRDSIDHLLFTSEEDILELPVPYLTLEEQKRVVEDHLRKVRDDYIKLVDQGQGAINILVVADKSSFEATYGEKLKGLGFKVLGYIEDMLSLKTVLHAHHGENTLSSALADAVIVCADLPVGDVEKAMFALERFNVRTFFYSSEPAYDLSRIDEFYQEDFNERFISGADFLDQIRKRLDADTDVYRQQFPKFFPAAERLDKQYGWGLVEYAAGILHTKPFRLDFNKMRSKLDETVCAFFKSHCVVPAGLDDGAVASLIADRQYFDGSRKVLIKLEEELPKPVLDAEAWYRYSFVAIRKILNRDSHDSSETDSTLDHAVFTLFTEIMVWFDQVRSRYEKGECMFSIQKDKKKLPFFTVEGRTIDGKTFLFADGVHLMDGTYGVKAGDQVVIVSTEKERFSLLVDNRQVEFMSKNRDFFLVVRAPD